jgi:hypothetical protein
MKRFLLFFVVGCIALINFSSCSKDNDDNDTVYFTTEELIGVWDMTAVEANGQWSELGEDNLIVFATSGSYIIHFQGNSYKGTYSVNGNTITGTTLDPLTEIFKVKSRTGNTAIIDYSCSNGIRYTFKVAKR